MTNYPLTNISPKAKIGQNVKIEPFTTIYGDVEIGDNTWIGSNVVIMDGARIGSSCKIFPGAIISAESQDLKYNGEYTQTIIGDNTTIREYVTIHKGTLDRKVTKIGSNCLLMSYVHVAHDCEIGNNVIIANLVQLAGHVSIDDWVIIEGTAAVQQFVHIGEHAFIAGGSLVRKNVPPKSPGKPALANAVVILAFSLAILMSHANASDNPAPAAAPGNTAIVGVGIS